MNVNLMNTSFSTTPTAVCHLKNIMNFVLITNKNIHAFPIEQHISQEVTWNLIDQFVSQTSFFRGSQLQIARQHFIHSFSSPHACQLHDISPGIPCYSSLDRSLSHQPSRHSSVTPVRTPERQGEDTNVRIRSRGYVAATDVMPGQRDEEKLR